MKQDKTPEQKVISTEPFTGSQKIYVDGEIHPIKVAMRQIKLSPTNHANGKVEENPPVTIYDTSGAYTDPNIPIDVKKGLPQLRAEWIEKRNDVEALNEISSAYGKERLNDAT